MGGAAGAPVAMDVSRANLGTAHLGFSFFFWVENVVGLIGLGFVIGLISFGFLIWALLMCKWTVNNIWTFIFVFILYFGSSSGPGKNGPYRKQIKNSLLHTFHAFTEYKDDPPQL